VLHEEKADQVLYLKGVSKHYGRSRSQDELEAEIAIAR
jgi:hypothetical protein